MITFLPLFCILSIIVLILPQITLYDNATTFENTFWLIIFLSAPFWVIADDLHEGWLHNVSKENGLSGETVSQIITGPDGQMWLATNDGVCRYNGREITAFAMPRQGYEPNYTHALTFAPDRSLYAATDEGLFRLRRAAARFKGSILC